MVSVSIVIVNWNGGRVTEACLDALRTQSMAPDEIVVVDNASTDGSPELIASVYPEVRLIRQGANSGFAAGTNAGIRASSGELVVTLNNDTVPAPGWLSALVAPFATNARLGATMSTMLFAHAPDRIASAGLRVARSGVAIDDLLGYRFTARRTAPRRIFGPSAGAAAYRRALFDDVGHFDESFFMYLEDVDLAWRARLRGWESLHVPLATVSHVYSASAGQGSALKSFHLARNHVWTLRKNYPPALARRFAPEIARYELGALAWAVVTRDRASLNGRAAGLRGAWIAAARRSIQARRLVADTELSTLLAPSPSWRDVLRLKRTADRLAVQRPGSPR